MVANAPIDHDPLLRFVPRADIYMPVPGGKYAVRIDSDVQGSIEEDAHSRNGGIIIGYCLRSSCSRITHLVVQQVCSSRIGGLGGANRLVLGVVKLPVADTPGYLYSLQGRDYARNFLEYGAYSQTVNGQFAQDNSAHYALWAVGMGPVAPLAYEGIEVGPVQGHDTITLQMMMVRDKTLGIAFPRFEVRHLCNRQLS